MINVFLKLFLMFSGSNFLSYGIFLIFAIIRRGQVYTSSKFKGWQVYGKCNYKIILDTFRIPFPSKFKHHSICHHFLRGRSMQAAILGGQVYGRCKYCINSFYLKLYIFALQKRRVCFQIISLNQISHKLSDLCIVGIYCCSRFCFLKFFIYSFGLRFYV